MTQKLYLFLLFLCFTSASKAQFEYSVIAQNKIYASDIQSGADQINVYLPLLQGKKVGIVCNQTAVVHNVHLVDTLLSLGVKVTKVFSPEHGFRGNAAAGQHIASGKDPKSELPIISLYGKNKKPSAESLKDLDLLIFDIQDVGARFYTFISSLHLLMEACAENNKPLLVLDRPNPNGFYVDGPVLDKKFQSFVGMDPIPVVHGLTVAEYAKMLNGEKWLKNGVQCDLKIVAVKNYKHSDLYQLPIAPSPNLPNMTAIYLYPSLCLFEGTPVSIGRGTNKPFQLVGHPDFKTFDTTFTPKPIPHAAPNPKLNGKACNGFDLSNFGQTMLPLMGKIYLYWITEAYFELGGHESYFSSFFDKLAGTDQLKKQIIQGETTEAIHASWQDDLQKYKKIRKKYLLYPDFE